MERTLAWIEQLRDGPGYRFANGCPRTLLATLPTGAFPGVDTTDVYAFLEAHAPR